MPARPNAVAVLADKLLELIRTTREQGAEPYPLRLSRLAALAGVEPTSPDYLKALKHKSFTGTALLAQKKNADSLVALSDDVAQLAGSDILLLDLLEQVCTPTAPTVAVAKLVKLVEKPLQQPFEARIQNQSLPSPVDRIEIKKKPHLFLKRMPPPPPPKAADVALAEKLLAALETRRDEANGFPWTMGGLLALAANDDPKVLKKALGSKLLKPRLVAVAKGDQAPVGLAEDVDRLVGSAGVLGFALTAARSESNQAVSLADLKKQVSKPLQANFGEVLAERVAQRRLPDGVGTLVVKKQACLFYLADALGWPGEGRSGEPSRTSSGAAQLAAPTVDFAADFERAFDELDRQQGATNLVSLVELRRAVEVDRGTFDRELHELRRAGRYSLSGAEGRHGLSSDQQVAAIEENGTLLLYVARRSS